MQAKRNPPSKLRAIAFPVALTLISSVMIVSQTTWRAVSHDLSSFLAPVVSITNGHSGLYATYFNVTPPGIHVTLLPWVWLFGPGIWSMYALHSLFVVGHQGTLFLALQKLLTPTDASLIFVATSVVMLTRDVFDEMLLSTELVGNTFILAGFCVLPFRSTTPSLRLWAAGIGLLTFAVLVREVYVFAPIMAVLAFVWAYRGKANRLTATLKVVAWATVLGAGPPLTMLLALEGLGPYARVLHLKRVLFPWPDASRLTLAPLDASWTFITLWPSLLAPAAAAAISIISIRRRQFPYVLLFCAIGVGLVGAAFTWQGKPASGHYLASLLPPLAGLLAISLVQIRARLNRWSGFVGVLLLLVPITALSETASELKSLRSPATWWTSTLGTANQETRPSESIHPPRCTQVVYGWNPGAFYIASESNPCSRYFLVNLIQYSPSHRAEYLLQLWSSPPAVVIYDQSGADLDVVAFENDVLPWRSMLATCYQESDNRVFVQRLDQSATRRCMLPFLQNTLFNNLVLAPLSLDEILSIGVRQASAPPPR